MPRPHLNQFGRGIFARYTLSQSPHSQGLLRQSGFVNGKDLVRRDVGRPFKTKPGSEVYKIYLADGTRAYLKRYDSPRRNGWVRRLLHASLRPSSAKIEYTIAHVLLNHGIDVMEPLAWGEERLFGVALSRAAILVREVCGIELSDKFRDAVSPSERHALLLSIGSLLGELHAIGFYHALRMHDLILTRSNDTTGLALIDLDLKGQRPVLAPYSHSLCVDSLVQVAYMFIRCRLVLRSSSELRRFFSGYRNGIRMRGQSPPRVSLRRLFDRVDSKLAEHIKDPVLAAAVPHMPRALSEILLRGRNAFEQEPSPSTR